MRACVYVCVCVCVCVYIDLLEFFITTLDFSNSRAVQIPMCTMYSNKVTVFVNVFELYNRCAMYCSHYDISTFSIVPLL